VVRDAVEEALNTMLVTEAKRLCRPVFGRHIGPSITFPETKNDSGQSQATIHMRWRLELSRSKVWSC